ncbi:hypothetical protein HNV12_20800, partial [Methanococcoides sp. SA1]|nr:hypothetical protein [Methanococcoides sp. SA1]
MEHISLRAFTSKENSKTKGNWVSPSKNSFFPRVLTFDTETTADEYLNLKFGSFTLHENDIFQYGGLFWDDRHVSEKEYHILKRYAELNNMRLFSLKEFIKIFYMEVYERETLCIGYNINFDLSRIIIDYGHGRYSGKDGFSFMLTDDLSYPRLRIKHLTGRSYNVEFTKATTKYSKNLNKRNKKKSFKGNFLDVQNLACTLTDNKSLSLEKACEIFDTP